MTAPRKSPARSLAHQLLDEAQALLARYGATDEGFQAIGSLLRALARRPELAGLIEAHEPFASIFSSLVLAEQEFGPALVLRRVPGGRATPGRGERSWCVTCVVSGRNRVTTWRRHPLTGEPERAGEIDLSAGDFVYFHEPPRDLRSEHGIGGPTWVLVLAGWNSVTGSHTAFGDAAVSIELAS